MVKQHATTDPHQIRAWAAQHGLIPVEILPSRVDHTPAMLAFAHRDDIRLQIREVAWDQFLALLRVQDLSLLYDPGSDREEPTDFYEIVHNRTSATRGLHSLEA